MQTILITGGNGFLGSNIVRRLIKNYKIVVLEKNTQNLFRLNDVSDKLRIYDVDEINLQTVFSENQIDIVMHTATVYGRNNETLDNVFQTNFKLPFDLLKLAMECNTYLFINTDTVLDRMVNLYALTKTQMREWLQMYAESIKVVNIQLEHFYGPGGSMNNFISAMIRKMLENTPEIELTKGEQKRNFIYYTDIVDAFELIINSIDRLPKSYNNFEVTSGVDISIKALVEKIKDLTGSVTELNFGVLPYRKMEIMESGTNNLLIKELGWKPKVSLDEGLLNTISYIKNNQLGN